MRFASQRHGMITNNIANLDTPNYRMQDVSVEDFQSRLGEAIDARRKAFGGVRGELTWRPTRELQGKDPTQMTLRPTEQGGLLYHDRATRDLERTMQDLVENTAMYQLAANLYSSHSRLLKSAISERVG